jgi:hypothetical protein
MNTRGHSPYITSSLTRGWVCRLKLLLVLASAVILGFESRGTRNHILLSQIRDSSNLEGQVPVFVSLRNRVTRLYPQALGSLYVASYDSQGYGGGIRNRLHAGSLCLHLCLHLLKTAFSELNRRHLIEGFCLSVVTKTTPPFCRTRLSMLWEQLSHYSFPRKRLAVVMQILTICYFANVSSIPLSGISLQHVRCLTVSYDSL